MWKVYIFLPIGMGIMILQYLADILSVIYNVKGN
jgi:TRAP-type C4-dicarboxylate transport system permease small subunit